MDRLTTQPHLVDDEVRVALLRRGTEAGARRARLGDTHLRLGGWRLTAPGESARAGFGGSRTDASLVTVRMASRTRRRGRKRKERVAALVLERVAGAASLRAGFLPGCNTSLALCCEQSTNHLIVAVRECEIRASRRQLAHEEGVHRHLTRPHIRSRPCLAGRRDC